MIKIYTDGSCLWNPWKWWWAAMLIYKDYKKIIKWNNPNSTNNQMELTAVIQALKTIKKKDIPITIYTDSKYIQNWITVWIKNWKKNWWKKQNKKNIKNKQLWQQLDKLSEQFNIKWEWVKAHSTNKFNNQVDKIAREQAEKAQK